jgi:lysophospholipase L1-like esterase
LHKRLVGLSVLVVALLAAGGAAEGALRVLSKHWLHVFDVEMWRYARLVKLESTHPGVIEEHRPNTRAFLMGVDVRTDAHGFRLPDPATETRRRPDDRMVAAVGDSVTFGWGVGERDTFPAQLENMLNARCTREGGRRATVHNAGIGNCNTTMELARYKLQVRPLHPDWVILGYSYNDAEPDAVPSTNPFLWHSALLALASARLERQTGLGDYNSYYVGLYRDGLPGWERCKRALREFGELLHADGVPATIILMPELHQPYRFGKLAAAFAQVAAISRASGFEVVDPSGDFPPGSGERFWVSAEDAHPNAQGQTIYARAIARSRFACSSRPALPKVAARP